MLSYKLKHTAKKSLSQHFLLNTTRVATATKISFESIACVYNKLKFDLSITAYGKNGKNARMVKIDKLYVPKKSVNIVPIKWFENQYQIRLSHFDANMKEEQK